MSSETTTIFDELTRHLPNLYRAMIERSPLPMAVVVGKKHVVAYVNAAYCNLVGQKKEDLIGHPFAETGAEIDNFMAILDRVYRTGKAETSPDQENSDSHIHHLSYDAWAIPDADQRPVGIVVQLTASTPLSIHRQQLAAMNQELMLSAVRQHEMIEETERLNSALQAEITERKLTEAALREVSQKAERNQLILESVIQQMPVGVILTDESGAVAKNNAAMDRIWKREMLPHENVESNHYIAYHKDGSEYRPEEWPLTRALRNAEDIVGEEMLILRGDGTKGTVLVSSSPIQDKSGQIIAGVVVDVDITDRKLAEDTLQTTLRRFYTVLSSMYSAVLLVTENNHVEFVNQAFCDAYGLNDSPTDLIGITAQEMIAKIKGAYPDPEEAVNRIRELVSLGQRMQSEEVVLRGELMYLRDYVPLCVDGESFGRLWQHTDISERKRVEEKLKANEKKLSEIYASMSEGLALHEIISDHSGKAVDYVITDLNPAFEKITGLNRDQIIGKKASAAYGTGEAPYLDTYAQVASTGKPVTFEVYFAPMNKYFSISVFSPDKGKFATIFQDITERKRAEESVERFKALMDHNPSLAFLKDESGRYVYLNNAYEKQFALSKDWYGKTDFDFWPKESAELFRANDSEILQSGQVKQYLEDSTDWNGTRYCWLAYKFTFTDANNKRYVGGIGINVTDRVRAEEALREREDRLRTLTDNSPDAIYMKDLKHRWVMANPAVLKIVNKSAEEALGKTDFELYADSEIGQAIFENDRRILERGKAETFEEVADTPDGRRIFLSTKAPWRDADGKIIGLIGISRDITDRKQAEEALRKAKDELEERVKERTYELYTESLYARSLIEASLDPLVTISVDGKITDVNHASEEVTGIPREQLVGSDFSDYFTEPEKARTGYEEVFRKGFVRDYPLDLKRRDGHVTPVLYNASVYRDDTGRNMGVFAAARDITERKQAESALRKLASELSMAEERERRRIAGVLHDDIAQILAAARLRLDMLQDIPTDQALRVKEAKAFLVESLQETRALMNDLGNPVLFELGLKAACLALVKQMMERHHVRISCDIQDAFEDLNPDVKTILYQVIKELLNNVVKHSQANNAQLMIDMENGHLRAKVTDDGVGFDPRTLGAPNAEGGFGLYSIKERLSAVRGSLSIESTPGSCTVVTAILPETLD
jgi:PAS domain S-box-containing protein